MTRRQLDALGMSGEEITRAVRNGTIVRVRRGWYCAPDADLSLQHAVRVGGRLTCVSELRRLGVWVLDGPRLHVRVPANAARLRDSRGVRLHWRPPRLPHGDSDQHVSVLDALDDALRCLDRRHFVASLDSALRLRLVTRADLAGLRRGLGPERAALVDSVDPKAESGLESIVRVLVKDLGLSVRSQVRVPGAGRVDLLVEGWVVVETDGDEFHDEKVTTRDRRRDAALARTGLVVLHFRYAQVVYELESVAGTIVATVATHRRIHNSGKIAARRRSRLGRMSFS